MVLHNSKWDKKATKRYNKKHGIVPEAQVQRQQQQDEWKAKKLQGNLWRFQQHTQDEVENEDAKRQVNELLEKDQDGDQENDDEEEEIEEGHTLREAALRPEDERFDELPEDYYLPPDEYSEDEEQAEIIKNHRSKAALQGGIKKNTNVRVHDNPQEFDRIQRDIDRNTFYKDVRRRFGSNLKPGRSTSANDDHDDEQEEDIDDFLNDIDNLAVDDDHAAMNDNSQRTGHKSAGPNNTDSNTKSQQFLDHLLS